MKERTLMTRRHRPIFLLALAAGLIAGLAPAARPAGAASACDADENAAVAAVAAVAAADSETRAGAPLDARLDARIVYAVARPAAQIDTTIAVRPGSRLELQSFDGTIDVATWSKNAVRIEASHGRHEVVEAHYADGVLRVHSGSRRSPPGSVDYRLSVPAWLPIALAGVYCDVTADGVRGGISVETVKGDVTVKGVVGHISLRTVEGAVVLERAKGRIEVSSVNEGVRVIGADGDILAESVNGDIDLLGIDSPSVEASTVNGQVTYAGSIQDEGGYRFSSHNGGIAVGLGDDVNALVSVSTFSGDFASAFPVRLTDTHHKRFNFTLGTGKARLELESFQGAIRLEKRATLRVQDLVRLGQKLRIEELERRKDEETEKGDER